MTKTALLGLALGVCAAGILLLAPADAQGGTTSIVGGPEVCFDLMAGQHIKAGTVCAQVEGDYLEITYATTDGWVLDEYHLWVGTTLSAMPQTKRGSPKIGHFPYTGQAGGQTSVTVAIDLTDFGPEDLNADGCLDLLVAAHAVVKRDSDGDGSYDQSETGWSDGADLGGKSWAMYSALTICCRPDFDAEGLAADIDALVGDDGVVGLQVTHQRGSADSPYFIGQLDYDGDKVGDDTGVPFYCVDLAHSIGGSWYCAQMVSSYDLDTLATLDGIVNEGNLDLANYVLNHYAIGDDIGNDADVTGGDMQRVLWSLVFGSLPQAGAYSSGPSSNLNVNEMLAAAFAYGEGYEPDCDGSVAVILYPVNCTTQSGIVAQALIAQALVADFPAACDSSCPWDR